MPPPWALGHGERFCAFPEVQEAGGSEEPTSFPGAGEGGWQQAGTLIKGKGPAGATHWLQRKPLPHPPAPPIPPQAHARLQGKELAFFLVERFLNLFMPMVLNILII